MANMDYPIGCISCLSEGSCSLEEDSIRDSRDDRSGKTRFWNSLSSDENRDKVDKDGEFSL